MKKDRWLIASNGKTELYLIPGVTYSREEFAKQMPRGSVAFDGIVHAKSYEDPIVLQKNFDHHIEEAPSALMQFYQDLMSGKFDEFFQGRGVKSMLSRTLYGYENHLDLDSAGCGYQLLNRERIRYENNDCWERLVKGHDVMDSGAGLVSLDDEDLLADMAWISEPMNGNFGNGSPMPYNMQVAADIFGDVSIRIDKYLMGRGEKTYLKGEFEILPASEDGIVAFIPKDQRSKSNVLKQGAKIGISVQPTGITIYKSKEEEIDMGALKDYLNKIDPAVIPGKVFWGGIKDIIVASPRFPNQTGMNLEKIIGGVKIIRSLAKATKKESEIVSISEY